MIFQLYMDARKGEFTKFQLELALYKYFEA